MQVSASTLLQSGRRGAGKIKVGDRVAFLGDVLRVLPGDDRILLILSPSGQKLTIPGASVAGGAKAKGGDVVPLKATVTRVGESLVEDVVPISMAVDGWAKARVTMALKSVRKIR